MLTLFFERSLNCITSCVVVYCVQKILRGIPLSFFAMCAKKRKPLFANTKREKPSPHQRRTCKILRLAVWLKTLKSCRLHAETALRVSVQKLSCKKGNPFRCNSNLHSAWVQFTDGRMRKCFTV